MSGLILFCIIMIIVVLIVVLVTCKSHENFKVAVPNEMTRDFNQQPCSALAIDEATGDAKAIVMSNMLLQSGRVIADAKDSNTCYILQDEAKSATDVLLRGFECKKDSALFKDNPLFTEVTFDPTLVNGAGYSIATGKCKMVLDPDHKNTNNLNAFWNLVGSSHCENYMSAMIHDHKTWVAKYDALLKKQAEKLRILSALREEVKGLHDQVNGCTIRVQGKEEDYKLFTNAYNSCNTNYTRTQSEFVSFKSACTSRITYERQRLKELDDLLYKQRTLLKDQEAALARLRTRLAEIEASLADAIATKTRWEERVAAAEAELGDLRHKVAQLIQETANLENALRECQEIKERLLKELDVLREKVQTCQTELGVCTNEYVPAAKAEESRLNTSIKQKKDIIADLEAQLRAWQNKYKACDPLLTTCRAEDQRILDEIEELKKRLFLCESSRTIQSASHQERLMDLTARLTEKKIQSQADIDSSACSRPVKELAEPTNQYQPMTFMNTTGAPAPAPPPPPPAPTPQPIQQQTAPSPAPAPVEAKWQLTMHQDDNYKGRSYFITSDSIGQNGLFKEGNIWYLPHTPFGTSSYKLATWNGTTFVDGGNNGKTYIEFINNRDPKNSNITHRGSGSVKLGNVDVNSYRIIHT